MVQQGFKTDHSTVTDFTYSQVEKHLRVNVTLRTTQYFQSQQIRTVEEALQKRFGPEAQLMVDQILVAQGGLSAEQMARIKDFISGAVVQPAPKEEPFDLKATEQKTASYLQKQVDDVLQGTAIRGAGPLQAEIGASSPMVLKLRLLASEPLEDQTARLLASQLSARMNMPVEVHGVVTLDGPNYNVTFESPDTRTGLVRGDRLKLSDLVSLLFERPDLQLLASVSAKDYDADALKASALWREVDSTLSRSRLKTSQWSMQLAPDPGTPPAAPPPPAANPAPAPQGSVPLASKPSGPVHCSFNVIQNF